MISAVEQCHAHVDRVGISPADPVEIKVLLCLFRCLRNPALWPIGHGETVAVGTLFMPEGRETSADECTDTVPLGVAGRVVRQDRRIRLTKAVAEILGLSSDNATLSTCSHLAKAMASLASEHVAAMIFGGGA
jgi:hypothetical protein